MKHIALLVVIGIAMHFPMASSLGGASATSTQQKRFREYVRRMELDYRLWRRLVASREIVFLPRQGRPVPVALPRAAAEFWRTYATSTQGPRRRSLWQLARRVLAYDRGVRAGYKDRLLPVLRKKIQLARRLLAEMAQRATLRTRCRDCRTFPV